MAFEPPERIYLQVTDEAGEPLDPNEGEGLTWCEHRQHAADVGYVREDYHKALLERALVAGEKSLEVAALSVSFLDRLVREKKPTS